MGEPLAGFFDNRRTLLLCDIPYAHGGAEASWTVDYHKYSSSAYPNASEPVIAGDYIYLAVDSTLVMLDKATGTEVKTARMASGISYTCRPVYARGSSSSRSATGASKRSARKTLPASG